MIGKGNLKGIGLFSLELLHLISIGKKESIDSVEEHFRNEDLIEYLTIKYKEEFFVVFDNYVYDNKQLNSYFSNYSGYIEGNESRKYGIMNSDDGLLLILALLMDKVETSAINWVVEE